MLSLYTCSCISDAMQQFISIYDSTSDPLQQDWLICPTQAMSRWVSETIAQATGIRAQLQRLKLSDLRDECDRLTSVTPYRQPSISRMTWALLKALPVAVEHEQDLAPIRDIFKKSNVLGARKYEFARGLAVDIHTLINEGPDWLIAWSKFER